MTLNYLNNNIIIFYLNKIYKNIIQFQKHDESQLNHCKIIVYIYSFFFTFFLTLTVFLLPFLSDVELPPNHFLICLKNK